MKIAFMTHWYDPEGGSAATSGIIARALVRRGHEVHAVTGFPIYPAGQVFEGYRIRPYQREVIDGVIVHRAPIYPSHDTRAVHRMANYLSFAAAGSAVALAATRSCDVGLVYSSPATAAVPGMALKLFGRMPYVMQIQDLWPDTVTNSGFVAESTGGRMGKALGRFCQATYAMADTVAVTSPGMATLLRDRGVDEDKLAYVPNWADEANFEPRSKDEAFKASLGLTRPFVAMYAGNLGEMQSLDTILNAAAELGHRHDIEIAIVGAGVDGDRLKARAAAEGLTNVTFVPSQPFSRMSDVLATGDVQIATLKDIPLFRSTTPSKVQANFAAGRPVIVAIAGDAARIVDDAGAGFSSAPGQGRELAGAIERMANLDPSQREAMGQSARRYYDAHFSEHTAGDRLVSLLQQAADNRGTKTGSRLTLNHASLSRKLSAHTQETHS